MATIKWVKVGLDIPVICNLLRDKSYTHRDTQEEISFHKGQTFQGIYKGYKQSERSFEVILAIPGHQYTFPFYASDLAVTLIAKQCFRCERYLSSTEFERHPLTQDKSPILSEVCEACYRNAKNKIGSYASEARRYGGKTGLRVSEWLVRLKASQGRCHYCHLHIGFEALVLEHCISLSLQGDNTKENVVPACHGCNSSKAGKDFETWKKTCIEDRRLMVRLQEHFGLSKSEVTSLAIKTLAQSAGLIDAKVEVVS